MARFLNMAKQKRIPLTITGALDSLIMPGVRLYFISPDRETIKDPNLNNRSLVSLLLFGQHRWLFMGDAEAIVENRLLGSGIPLKADVLKTGHHGSNTSSIPEFLKRADPDHAIISVGKNNRFNHPSPAVIERLNRFNICFHRTDLEGAAVFKSDGNRLNKLSWSKNR